MDGKREIKRCIIITGMSGAGKSSALNVFEDQGFYAIDNLPPALLPQLMDVLANHPAAVNYGVAAVVDARGKELLNDLSCVVEKLREKGVDAEVLFINASDEALVRRYETTRRRHPLADGNTILQGIREERMTLSAIMEKADIVIDTSKFKLPEFKARVLESTGVSVAEPSVIVSSFGFKYGAPQDADYIFRDEIAKAGLQNDIWQYFAVLTGTRTVGVMGDERTYDYTLALRGVTSVDGMTADWARIPFDVLEKISTRIVNEVKHINRIVYDITSKPPATIEWE